MLGCHDFCGYYEWTFHYMRRALGQEAVQRLWAEAIGFEAQKHYIDAARRSGLRGLYEQWVDTGVQEACDWTFTLDEVKNILRLDMRECPSKGFLTERDLNADEDYCDHCMGWVVPLLGSVGMELVAQEHNHCGQCWKITRMKDRPVGQMDLDIDIRKDPRWRRGYLHRWAHDRPLPLAPEISPAFDPCETLEAWARAVQGDSPIFDDHRCAAVPAKIGTVPAKRPDAGVAIVADAAYNDGRQCPAEPEAVLIGCPPADLAATAARYTSVPKEKRPVLFHAYLPGVKYVDFVSAGLPRPLPILPLLIRRGLYRHRPGGPHPTTGDFLKLLNETLGF
jgi:hypothetical protein